MPVTSAALCRDASRVIQEARKVWNLIKTSLFLGLEKYKTIKYTSIHAFTGDLSIYHFIFLYNSLVFYWQLICPH